MYQLLSTGQVARQLGVARHRLEYALANSHLPEPSMRIGNKRAFNPQEVSAIADYFGVLPQHAPKVEKGGHQ